MNTLILGAAGFIGLNLVDVLLARGVIPRCGRRKRTNVIPLRNRKVPLVRADLEDPDSLVEAMNGIDVVFHAAGYYPKLSLDREAAIATGLGQLESALDAAANAGVRRFIYVSSTATVAPNPGGGPSDESQTFGSEPSFGTYHALKWQMEARALREDRFETIVACPAACLGPWDLRVGTSALLVGLARGMDPPHPDGVVNLVDTRDVALALAALAEHEQPPGRILISARNCLLHDLLSDLSGRYGVAPPSAPISADAAIALADEEERRCEREGGRPAISREIVDLIVHGVPVDASYAEAELGVRWRPLSDTLDAFDDWARRMRIIPESSPAQEISR